MAFGDIARGLGQFGSDLGAGVSMLQNQHLENLKSQIEKQQADMNMQILQERLKQMRSPQSMGIIPTPGGGQAGVTFDPNSGTYHEQGIVQGMSAEQAKSVLEGYKSELPPEMRKAMDTYSSLLDSGSDPAKVVESAQKFVATQIGKPPKHSTVDLNKGEVTDASGETWSVDDPKLPDNLKPLVASARKAQSDADARKAKDEERRSDLQLARAMKLLPLEIQRSLATSATGNVKTQTAALLSARSIYQLMQAELPRAKAGDQQAMVALLTNHINMTLGRVKGGRVTRAFYEEAMQSAPWLSRVAARFDGNGFLSGVTLTPEQMDQMLDLGKRSLQSQADETAQTMRMAQVFGLPITDDQIQRVMALGGSAGGSDQGAPPPPPGFVLDKK